MRLKGFLVRTTAITEQQRGEMFALMSRHYDNVDPSTFAADLADVLEVLARAPGGIRSSWRASGFRHG